MGLNAKINIFEKIFQKKIAKPGPILAVYSVQLSHTITYLFSKYFQILYIFCPFLPFLNIFLLFCPFSEKSHVCPYFLEQALQTCVCTSNPICLRGQFGINCPSAFLKFLFEKLHFAWAISKFSKIARKIYPRYCPNQTCDYCLLTPNQQTLCIEANIFWWCTITNLWAGNQETTV